MSEGPSDLSNSHLEPPRKTTEMQDPGAGDHSMSLLYFFRGIFENIELTLPPCSLRKRRRTLLRRQRRQSRAPVAPTIRSHFPCPANTSRESRQQHPTWRGSRYSGIQSTRTRCCSRRNRSGPRRFTQPEPLARGVGGTTFRP